MIVELSFVYHIEYHGGKMDFLTDMDSLSHTEGLRKVLPDSRGERL